MNTIDIILGIALGFAIYYGFKFLMLVIKHRKTILDFLKGMPAAAAYAIRS